MNTNTLAGRLLLARTDRKMSQTQLAKAAGVSQGTVGNIEAGLRGGLQSLPQLAAALQIRYEWLRDGDGGMELVPSWPFQRVRRERWEACTESDRMYVELALNRALQDCEEARSGNAMAA